MIDSLYTRNFYPTNISGKHTRDSDCDPEIFHTPQSMSNICSVEVERTIFSRNFDIFLCVQKYPQHFFFFRKLNFFSLVFSNKKKSYSYKLYPVRLYGAGLPTLKFTIYLWQKCFLSLWVKEESHYTYFLFREPYGRHLLVSASGPRGKR